jgi:NADPH2:quinone reductase
MAKRVRIYEFGPSSVMKVEDFDPSELSCGEDQIVVQIKAFGVNPVETYIRSGQYGSLPELPYTPGKDGAGFVSRVGSKVTTFQPGNRVWITGSVTGSYAEYCVCKVEDVHHLPDSISIEQGASLGIPYRTAYRALKLIGKAKEGQAVLIHGATGGVGTACLQFAKSMNLSPIVATTSSADPAIIGRLKDDGAHIVTTHGNLELGVPVDIIIENLANANLGVDLKFLKPNGRVVVVGSRGDVSISPRDLMRCEGSIHGMVGPGSITDKMEADRMIQRGLESGELLPRVGSIFSVNQIQDAHEEVITHASGTKGKIVVLV